MDKSQSLIIAGFEAVGGAPVTARTCQHESSPSCTPLSLTLSRHGYFQSLPPREHLPLFWSDAELALLGGTELDGKAAEDRCDLAEELGGGLGGTGDGGNGGGGPYRRVGSSGVAGIYGNAGAGLLCHSS